MVEHFVFVFCLQKVLGSILDIFKEESAENNLRPLPVLRKQALMA